MAADSRDPITGAYIFSDMGASDIGVDPTIVSAQANDVGTRIIRASLAQLEAYEYKRVGLLGVALDTGVEYRHNGTGWVVVFRPLTAYTPTVTGLTLSQVSVVGKYQQVGSRVSGEVLISRNTAGTPGAGIAFSLPVPPADTSTTPRSLGIGDVYLQNSAITYQAFSRYTGGSTAAFNVAGVQGTAVGQGTNLSGTYPTGLAHGAGSFYRAVFEYEVA